MSRAWRNTTAWLRVVVANRSTFHVMAAKWRLLHYDHRLQVNDPTMQLQAAEFVAWRRCLSVETLSSDVWVRSFLDVATLAADRADELRTTSGGHIPDPWRYDTAAVLCL